MLLPPWKKKNTYITFTRSEAHRWVHIYPKFLLLVEFVWSFCFTWNILFSFPFIYSPLSSLLYYIFMNPLDPDFILLSLRMLTTHVSIYIQAPPWKQHILYKCHMSQGIFLAQLEGPNSILWSIISSPMLFKTY